MPPSAYLIFVHENRAKIKGSTVEVAMKLNKSWTRLAETDKAEYHRKASRLRDEYDQDMAAFRRSRAG